jgi:hypothetical protein
LEADSFDASMPQQSTYTSTSENSAQHGRKPKMTMQNKTRKYKQPVLLQS